MSPDSLPQLSLGTAALVIFAICAGYVLLRGVFRMVIATAVLAASAWLGYLVWQVAPELSVRWIGKSVPWLDTGLPIATFVVSFLIIRMIGKIVTRPFGGGDKSRPRSFGGALVRLIFALVPTSLIWLIGATLVHHAGSVAEIRSISDEPAAAGETVGDDWAVKLKSNIQSLLPEKWLAWLDPQARPERLALAKLITSQSQREFEPVIDPGTGRPIPRAIVVTDPALQTLAREGKFDSLLSHPGLTKALNEPKVQKLLRERFPQFAN